MPSLALALVIGSVAVVGYTVCLMVLFAFRYEDASEEKPQSHPSEPGASATTSVAPPFPRVAARAPGFEVHPVQPEI